VNRDAATFMVPIVGDNGKIGEIRTYHLDPALRISHMDNLKVCDGPDERERVNVDCVVYQKAKFAYDVDNGRVCVVDIYFHPNFPLKRPFIQREKPDVEFINHARTEFMRKHMAWFFTYGRREEREEIFNEQNKGNNNG